MHLAARWDPGTWHVLAHLDTNPIKCTYLHYAYTITVALIYNVCERRVIFDFSLWGGASHWHTDNWCYVGFTDPTAGAESTSLVNASDSSEHC